MAASRGHDVLPYRWDKKEDRSENFARVLYEYNVACGLSCHAQAFEASFRRSISQVTELNISS